MKIKSKKSYLLVSLIILVSILAVSYWDVNPKSAQQDDQLYTVQWSDQSRELSLVGYLSPRQTTWITAPENGSIANILTPIGSQVTPGMPLVTMKSQELQTAFLEALIEYISNRYEANDALRELQSQEKLMQSGSTPQNDLFKAQKEHALKEINTLTSHKRLSYYIELFQYDWKDIDQLTLSKVDQIKDFIKQENKLIHIFANQNGTFVNYQDDKNNQSTKSSIQPGMSVDKNQVIAGISDLNDLSIISEVGEKEIHHIQTGMTASLRLSENPNITFEGVVESVDLHSLFTLGSTSSNKPRFYPIHIKPNANWLGAEELGQPVKITFQFEHKEVLLIPIDAIIIEKDQYFILREDGREKVAIELGDVFDEFIAVKSGLSAGDRIITNHTSLDLDLL